MTQDENIADNNGLRQSYLAYQRYIRKQGPEQAIHGLEKFTSDQLFFISYALVSELFYRLYICYCQSLSLTTYIPLNK